MAVAHGEDAGRWRLAPHATLNAAQAWKNRSLTEDLGHRLRTEGEWACLFAEQSGAVHKFGIFSEGDRRAVVEGAKHEGVPMNRIAPMLHDVVTLPESELVDTAEAICNP